MSTGGTVLKSSPRGLRVLHVSYSFLLGGSELLARSLVQALPEHSHGVVSVDLPGPLQQEFEDLGAQTWCAHRDQVSFSQAIRAVQAAVDEFKPDVVHCHHLHQLLHAFLPCVRKGVPIVHTEHESFSLGRPKLQRLLRICAYGCRVVTAVDESVAEFLAKTVRIPRRKLQVIRNGVDVRRFANAAADRQSLGLRGDGTVIGVVARLHPVKGHSVLLHAFVGVKRQFPEASLLIVGDGEERAGLGVLAKELGIDDSVVFLGSRRDIPELLAAMDITVLPSLEEGLPLSLLEAMAAAKPIVATDVGAVPTVIRHNQTGLLVPPRDPEAITQALTRMLSDTELQRTLSAAAQGLAVDQYSLDRTAEAYGRIYASLCRPSR